ncbi:hypothetical protein [Archangium minus]|uniref:TRAFAC clade GTPase domain-containing protein n=1 Tax=Archangium minus TaxID=83450 RepID=UPI0037BEBBC0
MPEQTIVICGLPESGKTTFLAALWHLVTSREVPTTLRFRSLRDGDSSHLNAIASRWRNAKRQERTTVGSNRLVSMNLSDMNGAAVRLTFPDLSGESYRRMWEERDCDSRIAEILTKGQGMMLFVHADKIRRPLWVVDVISMSKSLGLEVKAEPEVKWDPRVAPTQVQLVDLLQLLRSPPLDIGPRRIAVMLSAWDAVAAEGRTPEAFLSERLPLLDQYLRQGAGDWTWRVFGVSAQGGEYEAENEATDKGAREEVEALRAIDQPSTRIRIVSDAGESHDLTEPISWLMR